jgi:uncharacterized protein YhaN
MIIERLHINEFGGLRDLDFTLSRGLNVITGDNESGKSTVLNFIRFLLYGLPASRGAENQAERERSLSWGTGSASGFMEISDRDGAYRIERSIGAGGAERKLIVSLATGAAVFPGRDAGEVFTGVSREVFDSICSVRQLGVGDVDGRAVGAAIENIMLSGDESVDTGAAVRRLDKARRELLALKGQGGRINDLKRREEALSDRLREAMSNAGSVLALQATAEKYRVLTSELRKKLDAANDRCHAAETVRILRDFESLHETDGRIEAIEREDAELAEGFGRGGGLPDGEYAVKLDSLSRRLGRAESDLAVAGAALAVEKAADQGDPLLAARHSDIEAAGGTAEVIGTYRRKRASARRRTAVVAVLAGAGLVILALALYVFFAAPELPFTLGRDAKLAAAIAGFLMCVTGVALFPSCSRKFREAGLYLRGFGYEGSARGAAAEEEFAAHADRCAEQAEIGDARRLAVERAGEDALVKQRELDSVRKEAAAELGRFFDVPEDASGLAEALVSAADRASGVAAKHAASRLTLSELEGTRKRLASELAGYDEVSLRAHLMPEAEEKLDRIGPQRLAQERDALAAQLEAATQRLTDAEKNLAILSHTAENPARLHAELEAVSAEREETELRCRAIILAQQTIEGAGESLRRNVTPRLRARAGELLSLITGGRYTDIGVSEDFSVCVATPSGTKDVSVMSGGTRDAAYLALRTALLEMIFSSSPPPLLLDEVCSQLDDRRTAEVLRTLGLLCDGGLQCVMFTCHSRERNILLGAGIPHGGIRLYCEGAEE